MTESTDTDPELIKSTARQVGAMLIDQQKLVLSEFGEMGRWLVASLLAVNGAAALSVFSAKEQVAHPEVDAGIFVLGVFGALAAAVLNQWANNKGAKVIGNAIGHAMVVAETGHYSEAAQDAADSIDEKLARTGVAPVIAGCLSACIFAIGTVVTGLDSPPVDVSAVTRCAMLQNDMLASNPKRDDSRELFETLRCKPAGDGLPHAQPARR